jgi:hypothetical protein
MLYPQGNDFSTHWIGKWVATRGGLDAVNKRKTSFAPTSNLDFLTILQYCCCSSCVIQSSLLRNKVLVKIFGSKKDRKMQKISNRKDVQLI